MDAISFVLGVKSAILRSSQLRDLVYRGRRLEKSKDGKEAEAETQDAVASDEEDVRGEGDAKTAWVLAVFQDAEKKEWLFKRTYVHNILCLTAHTRLSMLTHLVSGLTQPGLVNIVSTTPSHPLKHTPPHSPNTTSL
jgi:hypothetical protein